MGTPTLPLPRPVAQGDPQTVAGVDLGSNSFHMVVARTEEDQRIHILDRLRDPVRLAAGLSNEQVLSEEAIQRGEAALSRFGERVKDMPHDAVRAVGTNSLRTARNGPEVEERFSAALGHPVEAISGREEARLIYSGVSHTTPGVEGRLLVLDIGGGSTECIIGAGNEPLVLDSLYMGCVSYTHRFFGDGRISSERFKEAKLAAGLELASILQRYRDIGWDHAVGSSGTIRAVSEVLRVEGGDEGVISPDALAKLETRLSSIGRVDRVALPGLEPDRAAVFAGGVAILSAAFYFLRIRAMAPTAGALREGLLYELLGRVTEGDPRDATVETLASRYRIDANQADRVEATALQLFDRANEGWDHDPELARRLLRWAARLHEIGLSIAYAGHQRHGAYILEHADMPGFSIDEQTLLAAIVGAHRRKLTKRSFERFPRDRRGLGLHLAVILRLAVRLHHSRGDEPLPEIGVRAKKNRLKLGFPEGWLADRPLTQADLAEESAYLTRAGLELQI